MQVEPEITVKGMRITPRMDKLISRGIDKLEKVCDYIISARIALEQEQGRHQTGNPYRMRIDVRIPGRPDIVVERHSKAVRRTEEGRAPMEEAEAAGETPEAHEGLPKARSGNPKASSREEPVFALIRRSFDSSQRELEKEVEKQRFEVKTSANTKSLAVVDKLLPDQGYGFLRNTQGEEIYFHMHSVLHDHWGTLTPGSAVRYAAELGEKGLQATSVELADRPGVTERHNALHDLPRVTNANEAGTGGKGRVSRGPKRAAA